MHILKAKLLLLAIAVMWLGLILIMSPIQIPTTLFNRKSRYVWGIWIAQDQLINAVLGGNPDVTVSSRVGYLSMNGSKTAAAMEKVIDYLFNKATGQVGHCRASIEYDEEHH